MLVEMLSPATNYTVNVSIFDLRLRIAIVRQVGLIDCS